MAAWRLLRDAGVPAATGLAVDEALAASYRRGRSAAEPTLRLYTYRDHAALVGRYQHLAAEVDLEACGAAGVEVNRRPTGGGAIIMGSGQLGVALATAAPSEERPRQLLERYSTGLLAGLRRLGIEAVFRGKNDLAVEGRKIAGLGLYLDGAGGLLFHASVLADLDVALMLDVLRIPAAKLGERAGQAVEERVTTVSRQVGARLDGQAIAEEIAAGFAEALGVELVLGALTAAELDAAARFEKDRYGCPGWLEDYSPRADATATAVARLDVGLVRVYLALAGETIKSALFTGDFSVVPAGLVAIEEGLRWKRLERATVSAVVGRCLVADDGLGDPDRIVDAVLEAGRRAEQAPIAAPSRDGSCYFPEVLQRS
jgi:lipoate-protein ligase A